MFASVNGVELYYEIVGAGAPLIMVHGNGEDHTIFDKAAEVLSRQYRCILLDSRGHGQSTKVKEMDYDSMAQDVLALADALQLEHPLFYGFSDGGIIGLKAAILRPDYFRRVIVSGANIHPRGVKNSLYRVLRVMHFFTRDPKIHMMLEQPNIPAEALGTIRCPVLVLAGSKDVIQEQHTRLIAESIPGAVLKILPGEGHGSYIVHKEKIAEMILEFCKE